MNSFSFGRKVEICGEIYYLSKDMNKIAESMKQCSETILGLAANQDISKEEMMEKVREQSKDTIDTALGTGAFDKIFAQEEADVLNLTSLIDFITQEINEWKTELTAKSMAAKAMIEKRTQKPTR